MDGVGGINRVGKQGDRVGINQRVLLGLRQLVVCLRMGGLIIVVVLFRRIEHIRQTADDAIIFILFHRDDGEHLTCVGELAGIGVGDTCKLIVYPFRSCDVGWMHVGLLSQVVVIVLSSFLVATCPEAVVAHQHAHRIVETAGVRAVDGSVVRIVHIHTWSEVFHEIVGQLLHVVERIFLWVGIFLKENRIGEERHRAVVHRQLQVGPGTEGADHRQLLLKHPAATFHQQGVGLADEIVAVLDDAVEIACVVVRVFGVNIEIGYGLKVQRGILRERGQLSAQLSKQHRAVGHHLHLADDAHQ